MNSKVVVNCHAMQFCTHKKKNNAMHSKLNSINLDWRLLGARECLLKLPFGHLSLSDTDLDIDIVAHTLYMCSTAASY